MRVDKEEGGGNRMSGPGIYARVVGADSGWHDDVLTEMREMMGRGATTGQ